MTLWGFRLGTRLCPGSRALRKATGMLAGYLGKHPLLSKSELHEAIEACEDNPKVD